MAAQPGSMPRLDSHTGNPGAQLVFWNISGESKLLEGDLAVEHLIVGEPYPPHPPGPEPAPQPVPPRYQALGTVALRHGRPPHAPTAQT